MRVMIVGAGIAGTALASFLAKAGIDSILCERREAHDPEEGAFLGIAPNGMNVLRHLDLQLEVMRHGHACSGFSFLNAQGEAIGSIDRSHDRERFGASLTMIKRSSLHRILLADATRRGCEIRFGQRPLSIDESEHEVRARFAGVHEERADALVGCDGLRSFVRGHVFPQAKPPVHAGLMDCGGFSSPLELHPKGVALEPGQNVMVFGKRAFFGAFRLQPSLSQQSEVWWFHNGSIEESKALVAPQDLRAHLHQMHDGDPEWIHRCIDSTQEILGPWGLYESSTIKAWHRGRVCLIGDAAHAMSPSAGQGASLALEDAMVLAKCLRRASTPQTAFEELYALRKKRVNSIASFARRASNKKTMPGPIAAWFRDRTLPFFLRMGARAQDDGYAFRTGWE